MYIVKGDLEEKDVKAIEKTFEKILTDGKAKIIDKKEMGLKNLAYEIKKSKTPLEMFYHLVSLSGYIIYCRSFPSSRGFGFG